MVKYLTISLIFNLILFTLYSYFVGKALQTAFPKIEKFLSPLVVRIKAEDLNRAFKEKQLTLSGNRNNSKPTKVVSKPKSQKRQTSLLSEILPSVEKEYQTTFRKIISRAKANLSKGGKVKLSFNRKVLYIPPLKPIEVSYPPAPAEVRITVLPDGRVIDAVLVKRSGNPKIDRTVLKFAENLRFAPIDQPIVQEIYIEFHFKP